jgi:DNA-binding beta-propeller fold protein YncE
VLFRSGVVFVGNRADSQICPVDPHTLRRGECATVESPPDGIVLVPAVHQLWVTMPRIHALAMLRVNGMSRPTLEARLVLEGSPEGYAVDPGTGLFYTNLEDRNRTLAINARTRAVVSDWPSGCGAEGPRGLAIDPARHQLFVACTDRVVTLDLAHGGAVLGSVSTGGGVDLVDYLPARHLLFVGSGATAMLRVVSVDEHGAMRIVASAPTSQGARNAVVDERGRAYVTDSAAGRIFVTDAPP